MKSNFALIAGLIFVAALQFAAISAASSGGSVLANVSVIGNAVLITNLSTASSFSTGSTVPLNVTLVNYGSYAATNVILNVSIAGPSSFTSTYQLVPLSPSQAENAVVYISGAIPDQGTYTLSAFAGYYLDSAYETSPSSSLQFDVTQSNNGNRNSGGGGGGGGPPPITPVPGLSITTIPLTTSAIAGQGLVTQIALLSTANANETVTLNVGSNFTRLLSLSVTSLKLSPGQTAGLEATFKTNANTTPGTYIVPLIVNVSVIGSPTHIQTEYLTFTVYSALNNGLQVVGQTYLTDSLRSLSGVIEIVNNGNSSIYNGTLFTVLPAPAINNISDISAYGLPNNVTLGPNGYTITWSVGQILAGQQLYAYYQVTNITKPELVSFAQNIFAAPTPVSSSSLIKVVDIHAPQLYTDSSGNISVSVFYTGTLSQPVTFYLTGPLSTSIGNPVQVVNATPNQLLQRSFYTSVGNFTGTLIYNLYISSAQFNLSQSIPVLVLAPQGGKATTTTKGSQASESETAAQLQKAKVALAGIGAATIILIILLTIERAYRKREPKYTHEDMIKLARIKNRIKGDENA